MTIQTPTSDGIVGLGGAAPPAGLPDLASLAQLANQFFSAKPGDMNSAVPGSVSGTQADVPRGGPVAVTETGLPSPYAEAAPGAGRAGSPALGVPEAYAAALPQVGALSGPSVAQPGSPSPPFHSSGESAAVQNAAAGSVPSTPTTAPASPSTPPASGGDPSPFANIAALAEIPGVPTSFAAALPQAVSPEAYGTAAPFSPPSTPYYFLGEASAYPSAVNAPAGEDRVTAQSFGLPGAGGVKDLLDPLFTGRDVADIGSAGSSARRFYFLDSVPEGLDAEAVPGLPGGAHPAFDVRAVRRDFPILSERVNGRPLIWFDNAATTQKPQAVIDRLSYFYAHENSNIHRAAHELAARATDAYESARNKVARFLGAGSANEIIFVRGATEAINLVAKAWGKQHIGEGDEIIVTWLEHHANIVPWQQLCKEVGARLKVAPVDDCGQIILEDYQRLFTDRTKLVSLTQVSNALGTVTPVREMVEIAHRHGARALVDGAQAVSHIRVNVQSLDADFYVFSGHKVFAPTGIGVVYGKREILEDMQPWQGGGNMIEDVTFEQTRYQGAPMRFEAGTGNIADAAGLGAAIDYLDRIGMENISQYEHALLVYGTQALKTVPGLRLIGTAREKASVMSFVLDGYRPDEVGKALNQEGIAVRAGHHCAQPILRRFGLEATVRPSLAFYNTCEEIDTMVATLHRLVSATGRR
jgi:cysteine desulfurase/selenocysteine lyase